MAGNGLSIHVLKYGASYEGMTAESLRLLFGAAPAGTCPINYDYFIFSAISDSEIGDRARTRRDTAMVMHNRPAAH